MLQEASVQSAAGAGQGQPAEAPVTAVVNVGDYHGYLRPEALTVRGRAGERCPLPAWSHMAASASPGRFLLGNTRAWTREVILPGSADPCVINRKVLGGLRGTLLWAYSV